jgi:hypothetical protein
MQQLASVLCHECMCCVVWVLSHAFAFCSTLAVSRVLLYGTAPCCLLRQALIMGHRPMPLLCEGRHLITSAFTVRPPSHGMSNRAAGTAAAARVR